MRAPSFQMGSRAEAENGWEMLLHICLSAAKIVPTVVGQVDVPCGGPLLRKARLITFHASLGKITRSGPFEN